MKKAGNFLVESVERPKRTDAFPQYLDLELKSTGQIDRALFDGFFEGKPLRVVVFVVGEFEDANDYELVKKNA